MTDPQGRPGDGPGGSWTTRDVPPSWSAPPPPWPPPHPWYQPPPPPPPRRPSGATVAVAVVAVLAVLAAFSGLVGWAVEQRRSIFGTGDSRTVGGLARNPRSTIPGVDVESVASTVNPAVVNIATTTSGGGAAAGTGMVIGSSGTVLTNNHVISGATRIRAQIGITGDTYDATVLGYDSADDVALLQLRGTPRLKTIRIGNSTSVSPGDPVVAIGNARGRFGTPTAVAGRVEALGRTITAGSELTQRETLSDMIQIAASIEPGDSGGPLATTDGVVIGMNTAADTGTGRFGYTSGTTGFAIPIEKAMGIVRQIQSGTSTSRVHVGPRALLGVVLEDSGTRSGAVVADVPSGTPADHAGIERGDVIVDVEGRSVNSASGLRTVLDRYRPGDEVRVTWVDGGGTRHRATITLAEGPPG